MRRATLALLLLALASTLAGCGKGGAPAAPPRSAQEYNAFAVQFTETLGRRDYASAHAMLGKAYAATVDAARLQADFEALVPRSVSGIKATTHTDPLTDWPAKGPGVAAMVYVTIEGSGLEEFEAISLDLGDEAGQQKVFGIEYGRAD